LDDLGKMIEDAKTVTAEGRIYKIPRRWTEAEEYGSWRPRGCRNRVKRRGAIEQTKVLDRRDWKMWGGERRGKRKSLRAEECRAYGAWVALVAVPALTGWAKFCRAAGAGFILSRS